jgi:hypothetical protein
MHKQFWGCKIKEITPGKMRIGKHSRYSPYRNLIWKRREYKGKSSLLKDVVTAVLNIFSNKFQTILCNNVLYNMWPHPTVSPVICNLLHHCLSWGKLPQAVILLICILEVPNSHIRWDIISLVGFVVLPVLLSKCQSSAPIWPWPLFPYTF